MASFLVLCCFAEADTLLEKRASKKAAAQPPPYTDARDSCSTTSPIDHEKAALQKNLYSAPPTYRDAPFDKEVAADSDVDYGTKPVPAKRSANRRSVARPKTSSWASRIFPKKEESKTKAIVAQASGDENQLRWEHETALKTVADPERRKELEEKEARRRAQWEQQMGYKR